MLTLEGASLTIADCPSRCWKKRVYLLASCKENRICKRRRDTMTNHAPRRFAWRRARLVDRMFASEDSAIELETRGLRYRVSCVDPPNERRRWLAARATRSGVVAGEWSSPPGLHLARRQAPPRTHRVPLERRRARDGDSDGCPQNKGAHEWLKGGGEYRP